MHRADGGEPGDGDELRAAGRGSDERGELVRYDVVTLAQDLQLQAGLARGQLEVPAGILAPGAAAQADPVPLQRQVGGIPVDREQLVASYGGAEGGGDGRVRRDVVGPLHLEVLLGHGVLLRRVRLHRAGYGRAWPERGLRRPSPAVAHLISRYSNRAGGRGLEGRPKRRHHGRFSGAR